jgi:hypothetical protein
VGRLQVTNHPRDQNTRKRQFFIYFIYFYFVYFRYLTIISFIFIFFDRSFFFPFFSIFSISKSACFYFPFLKLGRVGLAGGVDPVAEAQRELERACDMLDTIAGNDATDNGVEDSPEQPLLAKLRESWAGVYCSAHHNNTDNNKHAGHYRRRRQRQRREGLS